VALSPGAVAVAVPVAITVPIAKRQSERQPERQPVGVAESVGFTEPIGLAVTERESVSIAIGESVGFAEPECESRSLPVRRGRDVASWCAVA
jgi:hypothetical protein